VQRRYLELDIECGSLWIEVTDPKNEAIKMMSARTGLGVDVLRKYVKSFGTPYMDEETQQFYEQHRRTLTEADSMPLETSKTMLCAGLVGTDEFTLAGWMMTKEQGEEFDQFLDRHNEMWGTGSGPMDEHPKEELLRLYFPRVYRKSSLQP